MAYDIKKLNADLRKALAEHKPKEWVKFHRGGEVHEKPVKQKNREDRRNTKRGLKKGDWE